jgi:hypothetical protein
MGGGSITEDDLVHMWNNIVNVYSVIMPQAEGIVLPKQDPWHRKIEYLVEYTMRLLTTLYSEKYISENYNPKQQETMRECSAKLLEMHQKLLHDIRYKVPYLREHAGFI